MSYITRKQAAERLSVSVRVLDGLIARGQLRHDTCQETNTGKTHLQAPPS